MRPFAAALALGLGVLTSVAEAQQQDDQNVLRALWADPARASGLFSDGFLEQVPIAHSREIMDDLGARCGALHGVKASAQQSAYVLKTASCNIHSTIHRDHEGKIVGLWFSPPARRGLALNDLLDALKRFDGSVSVAILQDGELIVGHAESEALAVGSAFKLVVLAALLERIDAEEAEWSDVVRLSPRHFSLPPGLLRAMPPGSPVTLHTLAALMIAESDNTATDALIAFIGRDRLERLSDLAPFLTTREFFLLKADGALYGRYAAADIAERRSLLESLIGLPLPEADEVARPLQPHAEWSISTKELCGWMERVAHLAITQINPGPLAGSDWQRVSFKGGSEVGVLNLTAQARDDGGRNVCVSATWNAATPIDEAPLVTLYASLFSSLSEQGQGTPRKSEQPAKD